MFLQFKRRKDFHVELNAVLLWGPFCWFDHLLNWSNHSARHHRAHLDPLRMCALTSFTKPRQPKQRKRRSCIFQSQDLYYHFSSKGSSCNLDSKLRLTGHVEETQFQISTWQFLMYMMWFCLDQIFCCQDTGDSYPVVTMCAACVPPYDPNTATQKHQRLGSNDQINILWQFFSVKFDHMFLPRIRLLKPWTHLGPAWEMVMLHSTATGAFASWRQWNEYVLKLRS